MVTKKLECSECKSQFDCEFKKDKNEGWLYYPKYFTCDGKVFCTKLCKNTFESKLLKVDDIKNITKELDTIK